MSPKSSGTIKMLGLVWGTDRVDVCKHHISHSKNCLQSFNDSCTTFTMIPWVMMFSDLNIRKSLSMYLISEKKAKLTLNVIMSSVDTLMGKQNIPRLLESLKLIMYWNGKSLYCTFLQEV